MCGAFGPNLNPSILPQLDELKWSLFPRWLGGLDVSGDNYKRASWHICKLLAKEEGTFFSDLESLEDCFSYREWMEILNKIASNRYWSQVPPEDRCVHNVSASQEAPSKPKSEKIETKFSLSKLSDYGKAKKKPTKVEELIILALKW